MPVYEFPIQRLPRAAAAAAELLGLRSAGVLRPAPRLRRRRRAGRPGPRVQGDGAGPAPGRHRSDPRRGLQPHGRRQRARAHARASRAWRTASTTCSKTAAALSQLLRLRQHAQRQPPDRPRDDLPLPPPLGPQLPRRRLPLRPGVDPQPRPRRRTGAQSAGGRVDRRRPAAGRHEDHRRGVGRRRRPTRWARSAASAGPNGTAATATTCAASGGAIRTWSACWPRGWPAPATCTRPAAGGPYHSINFITSHDGFTLNDLVSLQREAQRGQRRGEPRRREQQLQLQLRRRRAHHAALPSRPSACGRSRTCMASLLLSQGVPMLLVGRRMPPHAAGQQQRLLPGQRHLLVRLEAGRASTRRCGGSAGAGGLPPGRADGAADRFPPRPAGPPGRPARRELVQPGGRPGRLVQRRPAAWSACLAAAPRRGRPRSAEPSRADAVPRGRGAAAVRDPQGRPQLGLVAVPEHGGPQPARHLSGLGRSLAAGGLDAWSWRAARWFATSPAKKDSKKNGRPAKKDQQHSPASSTLR